MLQNFAVFALGIILLSSLIVVLLDNLNYRLIGLLLIYLAESILIALVWPLGLASIKFVIGTICVIILFNSNISNVSTNDKKTNISYQMLKAVISILVWLLVFYFSSNLIQVFPTNQYLIRGSFILIGLGIIQFGIVSDKISVIIGLLMFFAGFEILYSTFETSVLLAGLLAIVNLGVAFVGSYFLALGNTELEN